MAKEFKPRKDDIERYNAVMRMRVVDDTFFKRFIDDPDACEELLQVVLDEPRLRIKPETLRTQKDVDFVADRSIEVDAYVEDYENVIYNVEIQRFDNCNHIKRVRYNGSAITVYGSEPGDLFEDVRNVIVIYISEFDIFKQGLPIYHAYTTIKETNEILNDGLQMIYVNAEAITDTKLSRLMQRYKEPDFNDPEFPKNSRRMQLLKHDKKEVQDMCDIVRKLEEKAAKEATQANAVETAKRMLAVNKLSLEDIATYTSLPMEEVRKLAVTK